jgi:hypothetical protein
MPSPGAPLLDFARYYAQLGWPVFPCHGKQPLIAGGHGHLDASTDCEQITEWWTAYPSANIGRRLDPHHPVIDIDPRNAGDASLFILEQQYAPLPDTMRAVSGRGDKGCHYYFTSAVSMPHKVDIGGGIDVLADGYVILPPSLHPASGQPYLWDMGPDEVAPHPLPDWLVHLCLAGGIPKAHPHVLEEGGVILQGHRTSALAQMAIRLRRVAGCSEVMLLAALAEMNLSRCTPPKEYEKLVSIAHYVAGKYQPDPVMLVGGDYAAQIGHAANGQAPEPQGSTPLQWGTPLKQAIFTDYADMTSRTYPLPTWLIKGLLMAGFNILAGSPKSSKTYLAHSLALTLALESVQGGLWLDHYPIEHHGPVVYVSMEDEEGDSYLRCAELVPGITHVDRRRLIFCNDWEAIPPFGAGLYEFVEAQILQPYQPALVVLDPLSYLYPAAKRGGDQFDQIRQWLLPLRYLGRRYKSVILGVEHRRKQSKDDVDIMETIRGSTAKNAVADGMLVIVREQEDVTLHAEIRKGSDQTISLGFTFDQDGAAHWTWKGSTDGLLHTGTHSAMRVQVSQILGGSPLSSFTIPDLLAQLKMDQNTHTRNIMQLLLRRMEKDGEVQHVSRGHYSWVTPPPQTP